MYTGRMSARKQIIASGKTDKQLAGEMGLPVVAIWRWRNGRNEPRISSLAALAIALDCGVRDLLPDAAA